MFFLLLFLPSVALTQPAPSAPPQTHTTAPNSTTVPAADQKTEVRRGPVSIAVLTLGAQGVDQKVAILVTDYLNDAISKLPNVKVIGQKDIETMLDQEQKKQMAGCTDTSCVVAIGGAMGVDKIVIGNVGKLGVSYMMSLKLLDVHNAKVSGQFMKRLKGGSEEDFLDVVPEAVAAMFNLPSDKSVPPPVPVPAPATAPAKPPVGEVRTPSKSEGKPSSEISPATVSPANKIGPWVLVGIGAGALVAGGVCTGLAYSQYDDYKKLPQTDTRIPGMKDEIYAKEVSSYVLYGVGGAAVIGGLVWYFVAGRSTAVSNAGIEFVPVAPIGSDAGGTIKWKW